MNKSLTLLALGILFLFTRTTAQTFSPITVSGHNFDAVAEATTALATTSGPLDGSNFVLYSAAYGAIYSVSTGLPNNGIIASGTSTYQLEPYTANNMLHLTAGLVDSLSFNTPAAYSGISILCFSTEGNGSMNVTIRFTDNTTQTYTNQALTDWFGTGTAVISGFDRVSRTGTTPANASGNPKMFAINLPISCANRAKNIQNIKFENTGTNPRNCIMAVSGAAMPTYSVSFSPVTCTGGTNGSATVTASGGLSPYTYTWSTNPPQTGANATMLSVGVYSIISQDAGLCPVTTTVAISQSLVPEPALTLSASANTVCAGASVSITASGAASYTWNTASTTASISDNPSASSVYTVGGFTSFNCYRTGSINITVNQLPVINFNTPAAICINAAQITLTATPAGGWYTGTGITGTAFSPALAGVGSQTLSYSFSDNNGCVGVLVNTIVINDIPALAFTLSPTSLCTNSGTLALTAQPANGTFSGPGVNGSVYSPSVAGVGTQTVSYSYTDANNCTNMTSSSVVIHAAPVPTILTTKKLYCTSSPTLYLNAQPSGGIYTGAGTSTVGVFSAAAAGAGTHSITYTYSDANGCTGKALFSATVTLCNGISENASAYQALTVYPNPNAGSFTVKSPSAIELILSNELGQTLRVLKLNADTEYKVFVDDLPTGIYFLSGTNNPERVHQKIIVSH